MRRKKRSLVILVLTLLVVFFFGTAEVGAASEKMQVSKPVAQEMKGWYGINWMPNVDYSYLVLTVSKPDGEIIRKTFDAGSAPYFNLYGTFGQKFPDGSYTYELRAIPVVEENTTESHQRVLTQTGYFLIWGGRIVIETDPEDNLDRAFCGCYEFDDTDVVVEGKLCAGRDCLYNGDCNKETLRLKEEVVRILFMDTSTASYPDNDWQIIINDDDTGSGEYFSIQDVDTGKRPFTIEAGAQNSSLYIDDSGKIGIGTSTPVVPIELVTTEGQHASINLKYTNYATAVVAARADKTSFGSKTNHRLNLVVNNTYKVTINTDGYVGIGDETPSYPIEVAIANGAYLNTSGNWVNPSSRELKENIEALSADEAIETLEGLNTIKYNYKVDKTEGYVGFISEDVPELVAVKDRKGLVTMDIVAVLTRVVQEQQKTISKLKEKVAELESRFPDPLPIQPDTK